MILEREEAVWSKGKVYLADDIGILGNEVWYTVMVHVTDLSPVAVMPWEETALFYRKELDRIKDLAAHLDVCFETQRCGCGQMLGFKTPLALALQLSKQTERITALTERCKELEKWASEHGLFILDKKEFWGRDLMAQCLWCGNEYAEGMEGVCRGCWEKHQFGEEGEK